MGDLSTALMRSNAAAACAARTKQTQRMVQQRSRLSVPQLCAHRRARFRNLTLYKHVCAVEPQP